MESAMKCLYILIMSAIFTMPAYAGHGTIRETDEQIIIEYSGDEDDTKAVIQRKEELTKEEQEQKRKQAEEAKMKAAVEKEPVGSAQTVRETDKVVTVEYSGGEDAAKATLKHQEDLAKEEREQIKRRAATEKDAARATRRATTRPERAD